MDGASARRTSQAAAEALVMLAAPWGSPQELEGKPSRHVLTWERVWAWRRVLTWETAPERIAGSPSGRAWRWQLECAWLWAQKRRPETAQARSSARRLRQ
jgi:hypothetical protein